MPSDRSPARFWQGPSLLKAASALHQFLAAKVGSPVHRALTPASRNSSYSSLPSGGSEPVSPAPSAPSGTGPAAYPFVRPALPSYLSGPTGGPVPTPPASSPAMVPPAAPQSRASHDYPPRDDNLPPAAAEVRVPFAEPGASEEETSAAQLQAEATASLELHIANLDILDRVRMAGVPVGIGLSQSSAAQSEVPALINNLRVGGTLATAAARKLWGFALASSENAEGLLEVPLSGSNPLPPSRMRCFLSSA